MTPVAAPGAPFVSIVVPCRNEERFIDTCLQSIAAGDFPRDRMEVLVVDGMSTDDTRAIVQRWTARDATVRLVDNPGRTAPAAMNVGIRASRGSIVIRLDAHCRYPATYVSALVAHLESSGADNVGGLWRTLPASTAPQARAIAIGMSHPFGVGNSHFRIGTSEPRWVDTVPFGCYRREVFDRIGLFDEDLVRNQDDELNARLIKHGGRILLVPDVVCDYYARESVARLWRMYFQYGYFKPLAARKLGRVMTFRQLVPAAFVAGLAGGAVAAALMPVIAPLYGLVVGLYVAATVVVAIRAGRRDGLATVGWLCVVFPCLHLAYGTGFLKGLLDFVILNRRPGARERALAPSR